MRKKIAFLPTLFLTITILASESKKISVPVSYKELCEWAHTNATHKHMRVIFHLLDSVENITPDGLRHMIIKRALCKSDTFFCPVQRQSASQKKVDSTFVSTTVNNIFLNALNVVYKETPPDSPKEETEPKG